MLVTLRSLPKVIPRATPLPPLGPEPDRPLHDPPPDPRVPSPPDPPVPPVPAPAPGPLADDRTGEPA